MSAAATRTRRRQSKPLPEWMARVTPKARFGKGRQGKKLHTITEAVARLDGDRIVYRTVWACGAATNDAILVADPFNKLHCYECGVTRGPVVYRLFDEDDRLLYVGYSIRFEARLAEHMWKPWWHEVRNIAAQGYPSTTEAQIAEYWALVTENPIYSKPPPGVPRALGKTAKAAA